VGCGCGLIWYNITALSWRFWRKSQKFYVRVARFLTEALTFEVTMVATTLCILLHMYQRFGRPSYLHLYCERSKASVNIGSVNSRFKCHILYCVPLTHISQEGPRSRFHLPIFILSPFPGVAWFKKGWIRDHFNRSFLYPVVSRSFWDGVAPVICLTFIRTGLWR
jgi:hypothetical protein